MSDLKNLDGLPSYDATQLKKAFLILAASGKLDEFEKTCNDRGLKIYISNEDQLFMRDELNNILGNLLNRLNSDKGQWVAHQGCPC